MNHSKRIFTRPMSTRTPTTTSTSNDDIQRSVDLAFGILVMILNIAEILIISQIKRKKKIYEIFILSLSVTDLLFGLSNVLVSTIYLSNTARYDGVREVSYTTYFYFVLNSILHLAWIALDRLWTVCKPFQHRHWSTRKNVYILIACTWITSTLIAGSLLVADKYTGAFVSNTTTITYENVTENTTTGTLSTTIFPTKLSFSSGIKANKTFSQFEQRRKVNIKLNQEYPQMMQLVLSIFIILADVLLIACYSLIIYLLNKKKKVVVRTDTDMEERVSIICVVIAATFVLFTLPYALDRLIEGRTAFWATLILVSNSGLNSIIYFFRGKCEQYQEKLAKKNHVSFPASTIPFANGTPLSTPGAVKKEVSPNESYQRKLSTDF